MKTDKTAGIFAAILTPQKQNLDADIDLLYAHYQWLLQNGCHGVALFGTTGEFASFGINERKDVIAAFAEKKVQKNRVLIGTGCTALTDVIDLSRTAVKNGFYNILVLPPFYYKTVSDHGLLAFYETLIQRIGSTEFRLYVYNFPRMTGIQISFDLISHLHALYPQTVAGLKDSGGDLGNMLTICERIPDFNVFSGSESLLLDLLKGGGAGCISATANITSRICTAIFTHWKTKDVSTVQQHLSNVRSVIEQYPVIPALKAIMAEISENPDWLNMRPPHKQLPQSDKTRLIDTLRELQILT